MKRKNTVFYILWILFVAAIIALDQWTKYLTVQTLPLHGSKESILGIFHITHARNTGGAWGILAGQTWLFVLVMVAFLGLIGVMLWRKWLTKKFEWVCIAAIVGGGLGNMIDRLLHGAVTDMIAVDFIDFPVFNVADCFITVGCIALLIYVLIFDHGDNPKEGSY